MTNKSAAFIPSKAPDASVMRARDVREMLKGHVHPLVSGCIERIAEINHVNSKAIAELATMMNQLADNQISFAQVAENMKTTVQKMGQLEADVPDDVNTDEGRMN